MPGRDTGPDGDSPYGKVKVQIDKKNRKLPRERRCRVLTRRKLLACGSLIALSAFAGWSPLLAAESKRGMPVMLYKTPGCECCSGYAGLSALPWFHRDGQGDRETRRDQRQCRHPARASGLSYLLPGWLRVDGHVPIEAVQKLLAERPAIKGLALAGMPTGSPGMPGPKQEPFIIHAIDKEGKSSLYMKV